MIVVDQRLAGVVREQLFGEFLNQRLGMKRGLKVIEPEGGALLPLGKEAVILLLSDYDENSSAYSLTQACDAVLAAGQVQSSPLACIKLGYGYPSSTIIMEKLNQCGNGEV